MHALTRTHRTMLYGLSAVIATFGFSSLGHAMASHHGAVAAAKTSTCTLKTADVAPTAINDEDFGTLECSRPFGTGVQHNTATQSPTSLTTGTLKGESRLFFKTGTVCATFSMHYTISGSSIAYAGTAKVTGGTGTYKGISGSAKLTGSSADGGTHGTTTEKITVKLP
jgi:hypothetical protein